MKRGVIAGAFALALLVTACGSSGDEAMTKADFLSKGNEICKVAAAELDKAGDELGDSDPDGIEEAIKDVFVPGIRGQIDDLRALGYPEGDKDTLEATYSDAEELLDAIEQDPAKFLAAGEDPFAAVNEDLSAYGLTECGSSGS